MKKTTLFLTGISGILLALGLVLTGCPIEPEESDNTPTVSSVTVSPPSAIVTAGGDKQFSAVVTGTNSPAQTVTWSVTGNNDGGTVIANGLLTVAAGETAETLTVRATSTVDITKSGTATVTVIVPEDPSVIRVTVSPATPGVAKDGTKQFTAVVTGPDNPAQTVTWTVEGGVDGTTIDTDGLLTVAAAETASTLTVKAAYTVDPTRYGTATVTVYDTQGKVPTVSAVTVSPAAPSVAPGGNQQFTAEVTGTKDPAQTVTWSVTGNKDGGTIITAGGLLVVAAGETAAALTVTAASTVDHTVSGMAVVLVGGSGGGAPPMSPLNVKTEALSPTSVSVSWDDVTDALIYKVYRYSGYSPSTGTYTLVGSSKTTSYTDTGLSPGTGYYYKVSAVNSGGESSQSSGYTLTSTPPLPVPANVKAEALSSTSIRVTWDGVADAESYKIYRGGGDHLGGSSFSGTYIYIDSSIITSYTDTGLSPSGTYGNRYYYYRVSAVTSEGESSQSNSASAYTMTEAEDTTVEGVYVGIISFAGEADYLMTPSLVRLDASGRSSLVNRLNSSSGYTIADKSGTALFYAVHKALANLKMREDRYPADLDSVNVITFTDGLDNGSLGMSMLTPIEGQTFSTDDAYTTYLSGEIAGRTIAGKPVTAYSIGVMGSDVTNTSKFTNDLAKLASTGKSQTLTDFNTLQATFQDIADSLGITQTASTNFTMKTTLLGSGAKVRMTFDVTGTGSADAMASQKYIEGTITASGSGDNLTYTFGSISYGGGLDSQQGAGPITGKREGTVVNFAFTGVEGYNPSADNSKAKQWTMAFGTSEWQVNSEYTVTGATDIEIEALSSIIYLVLDRSTSLNTTQIEQIRNAAASFINSLYTQLAGLVPTGVSAAAQSANSIKVSWDPIDSATSFSYYRVYRSASSDGPYTYVPNSYTSLTSYTDTGLSSGATYYYKVSASFDSGSWNGAQSAYASATTD